ncbi:MAG: hypothetical protein ACRDZW_00235, partial [Acidimicrobiales bacterium]
MSGVDEVAAALEAAPGRTAGEVRDALRSAGRVSLTTGDVSRVLTTFPRRFHHDGSQPPRWWPATNAAVPAVSRAAPAPGALPPLHAW